MREDCGVEAGEDGGIQVGWVETELQKVTSGATDQGTKLFCSCSKL